MVSDLVSLLVKEVSLWCKVAAPPILIIDLAKLSMHTKRAIQCDRTVTA
jgi:hypothetical protein